MIHFNCYIHTHIYSIEKDSVSTSGNLFFLFYSNSVFVSVCP